MIRVNARLFAAAAIFVSTEETRYYLNGVHVTPHHEKGAVLVATDGHRLIVIHDEEGECTKAETINLPQPLRDALLDWIVDTQDDEWGDDETIKILGTDRTLRVDDKGKPEIERLVRGLEDCRIDGKYPEWQKVVPKPFDGQRASPSFSGTYLGDFGRAAKLISKSHGTGADRLRVVGGGTEADAGLILFKQSFAFGVIMPLKADKDAPSTVPEFFTPPSKEAA